MGYEIRWLNKTGKREKLCAEFSSFKRTVRLVKSILANMPVENKIIITKK